MSFAVAADAYDRFMGRYSTPLARLFADFAGIEDAGRVIDVGCGPGALTAELVERLGADAVAAVDPSEPFVVAASERYPGVTVRQAAAEALPFEDQEFEAALAQLVVHFMKDPVGGLREMARVTAPGGVVAASVWDHGGGQGPLSPYWEAVHELDDSVDDESQLAGAREGHLTELFRTVGLDGIDEDGLWVEVEHATFDEWWEPYTLGVGPAGAYVVSLDPEEQDRLRELCRKRLPDAPFVVKARAWAARACV